MILRKGIHACCSRNWNAAVVASKPDHSGSERAAMTVVETSAQMRWAWSPRSRSETAAAASGLKTSTESSGKPGLTVGRVMRPPG